MSVGGLISFQPEIQIAFHALIAALVVWGGLQDWRRREVTDWLTWPLFVMGAIAAIGGAVLLDLIPLIVCVFVLTAWYFGWLGGADARVLVGLWGLWPLAGFLGIACTGVWGLALILRKQGRERIPALVTVAFGVAIQLISELYGLRGLIR